MTLFYRVRSRYHVGRSGFTLIELIVVTVIIGILASITAKLVGAKKHAYLAEMKSDLRNLAAAEEAFHGDNFTYTGTIGVGMGWGWGWLGWILTPVPVWYSNSSAMGQASVAVLRTRVSPTAVRYSWAHRPPFTRPQPRKA